ncbi:GDSL-type esterase/lipase family protein [Halomonas aquatica]|uniref:GDSL-type esterase/lipase family protein n=1 Tax=Halomonas aquatica TaxID=3151123 RepID=A0ABV1NGQ9_9GAMM
MFHLNRVFKFLAVLVVTVLLNGCNDPKLDPIARGGTILAFGDSLTEGVGTTRSRSYPAVLADLTGLNVINAGVSGETTDKGLERFPVELERSSPDLVILIEGGNDILRNKSHSSIKKNLRMMIEMAESRGIPVVLVGVPKKSLFSSSAPFYEELAEDFDLVYDGSLIVDLLRNPSLKSDQIHFNEAGYQEMAESIHALMKNNGALP